MAPLAKESGLTSLPTLAGPATPNLTQEGTILGTFQYMAPEQLEGHEADARTDIFALGAVLYEMATGRKAFSGKSQASLISSIMKEDPAPISTVEPMTPPALDRVVRTCLAKDPEDRFQTAHDVKLQLQWVAEGGSLAGAPAVVVTRRKSRERLAWAIAAIAVVVAALSTLGYLRRAPVEARCLRTSILPPEKATFDFSGANAGSLTVSPDGRLVTFVASLESGRNQLWVRALDQATPRPIAGTEGAQWPFWSPDSRFIAFFADGKLKKVDVSGAPPLVICDARNGRAGSWNREGVVLFSPDSTVPIHRVPAGGGTATPVTVLDASKGETTHRWATFLPDGRHFLYMAGTHAGGTKSEANAVYVGALDSKEKTLLLRARSNVAYASGYLVYVLAKTLLVQPFDAKRQTLTGDPIPYEESILYDPGFFRAAFSVSESGVLVYATGTRESNAPLVWYDLTGKPVGDPVAEPAEYGEMEISPDGKRVAAMISDSTTGLPDIWLIDLSRRTRTRFTFGPGPSVRPTWSPDGSRIAYAGVGTRPGPAQFFSALKVKPIGGAGKEEVLFEGEGQWSPTSWSPDGRFIALEVIRASSNTKTDVWILPLDGDRKPYPFLESEHSEESADFSSDGRWVSYMSDESGRDELYVTSFPARAGKWQISNGGAVLGFWCGATKIFYLSPDLGAMFVDLRLDPSGLEAGPPRMTFKARRSTTGAASPKCDRFLLAPRTEGSQATSISLVSNWPALLKK
jgi:Tol biopolymer transport system component